MSMPDIDVLFSLLSVVSSALVAIAAVAAVYIYFKRARGGDPAARGLEAELQSVRAKLATPDEAGLAEKQYALLREYHAQGLAQSKTSFWFSLVFAALGFFVIVTGLFTFGPNSELIKQGRTVTALIAGTVIDAVAGLFFVQSNKARELLVQFFDRFRNDRKLDEALRLASLIPDVPLRSKLYMVLALHFVELKTEDGFAAGVLSGIRQAAARAEEITEAPPAPKTA